MMKLLLTILSLLFLCGILSCDSKINPDVDSPYFIKFLGTAFNETAYAMENTPDGGFIVVGTRDSVNFKTGFVAKVDKNGNKIWQTIIHSTSSNDIIEARDVVVKQDGKILVLGYITDDISALFFGECVFLLIQLDADGKIEEKINYSKTPLRTDGNFYLTASTDGGFLLLGTSFETDDPNTTTENSDMYLLKIDANKNVIFERPFGLIDRNDPVGNMIEVANGDLVWCGTSNRQKIGNDIFSDLRIIRANQFGNLKWDFPFEENDGKSQTGADIQTITATSEFVSVGTFIDKSNATDTANIFVVKVKDTGELAFSKKIEIPDVQFGTSISPTSDNGFIITGSTGANEKEQVLLIKLSETGDMQWNKTFALANGSKGQIVRETIDGGFLILATIHYNNNDVLGLIKINKEGNLQ